MVIVITIIMVIRIGINITIIVIIIFTMFLLSSYTDYLASALSVEKSPALFAAHMKGYYISVKAMVHFSVCGPHERILHFSKSHSAFSTFHCLRPT